MIKPENARINVHTFPEKKKVTACFDYNNHEYKWLVIKDPIIEDEYLSKDDGWYDINNEAYFVVSLSDKNTEGRHPDNKHYKIIATVL